MLPPGRGKLATNPLPTGSETTAKTRGMVRVCCCRLVVVGVLWERTRSGCNATSSFANRCSSASSAAAQRMYLAAIGPPELLEFLPERRDKRLSFRVVLRRRRKHADPPHPASLLRACGNWPCHGAAKQRDEFATPHGQPSSVRPHPTTPPLGQPQCA